MTIRTGRVGALWCMFFFCALLFACPTFAAETGSATAPAVPAVPAVSAAPAVPAVPASAAPAGNPDDVLVSVGDKNITRAEMMTEIENFKGATSGDKGADFDSKEVQKKFLQQLSEITLLEKKATEEKISDKPELGVQVKENSLALLANAYIRKFMVVGEVTKAQVDEFYKQNNAKYSSPETFHLHQMTFETEEAANNAKKELDAQKSFAELAKSISTDTFKSSGGDRGFIAISDMDPLIANAIVALTANKVAGPIKEGEKQFLLVKYSEKKEGQVKPLAEVSTQIEKDLKEELPRQALEKRMAEIEKEFSYKLEEKSMDVLRQPEFKPEDLDKTLFTLGTETVKIQALIPELDRIPPFIRPSVLGGEGLKDFVKQFCHRELLKRYVGQNFDSLAKEYPQVLKDAGRRVVLKFFLDEKIGNVVTVSDDEIKEFYTKNLGEFSKPEQVHAHHILVDAEEKAKELKGRLEKNEKFEDLAKAESKCPSAKEGGDLGFFGKGQMVPEFDTVAQTAEIGKVVGPVKTKFGYHLIRVDERRPPGTVPLEEVKDQIRSKILPQKQKAAFEKLLADLKKEYPVKEYFEKL